MEDGGGGARGPCTAARNASSWSLSAAARSASFSAATARRRFFSFFRSFFRRFRFFSSLRSRFRFFSFLRRRLRLRSSLLELLELDDELDELDDEDAIFCAPRLASSAWALMCTAVQSLRCVAHQCGALQLVCALLLLWQTSATPEALRKLIQLGSWISYSCTASTNAPGQAKPRPAAASRV